MNERIEHITKQVDEYFDDLSIEFSRQSWMEKFAELIVGECIEIIEPCKCGCRCEQEVVITDSIIADIKEHFGIEQ